MIWEARARARWLRGCDDHAREMRRSPTSTQPPPNLHPRPSAPPPEWQKGIVLSECLCRVRVVILKLVYTHKIVQKGPRRAQSAKPAVDSGAGGRARNRPTGSDAPKVDDARSERGVHPPWVRRGSRRVPRSCNGGVDGSVTRVSMKECNGRKIQPLDFRRSSGGVDAESETAGRSWVG